MVKNRELVERKLILYTHKIIVINKQFHNSSTFCLKKRTALLSVDLQNGINLRKDSNTQGASLHFLLNYMKKFTLSGGKDFGGSAILFVSGY
jgi:hypothetical protein